MADPTIYRFTEALSVYGPALKALIAAKQKGRAPSRMREPEDTGDGDLMAALRASLQGSASGGAAKKPAPKKTSAKSSPPAKTSEPKKPAAKKAPAKKTAAGKKAA